MSSNKYTPEEIKNKPELGIYIANTENKSIDFDDDIAIKYPYTNTYYLDDYRYKAEFTTYNVFMPNIIWKKKDGYDELKLVMDNELIDLPYDYCEIKFFFKAIGFVWYTLRPPKLDNDDVYVNIKFYDDILILHSDIDNMHRGIESLIIGLDIIEKEHIFELDHKLNTKDIFYGEETYYDEEYHYDEEDYYDEDIHYDEETFRAENIDEKYDLNSDNEYDSN